MCNIEKLILFINLIISTYFLSVNNSHEKLLINRKTFTGLILMCFLIDFQNGSTNLRIISQGPVFKGIVNALSKSESLLEKFWLQEIVPRVEKSSTFKTSLAFGLLKLIAPVWTNKETLGTLLPKGLAEVSLKLL